MGQHFWTSGIAVASEKINEQKILDVCETLTQRALEISNYSEFDKQNIQLELFIRYASVLQIIFKEVESCINVACDFSYERIMIDAVIEIIRERITATFPITLTRYNKNNQYDIILTNQVKEYPLQKNARVFVMLSNEYDFDFPYVNEILKECYLEKIDLRMRS